MLLPNKKVAIVGGGPGGLTLARLLQLKGVDVKGYERDIDKSVRQQGATLDLHYGSGLKALREGRLIEEVTEDTLAQTEALHAGNSLQYLLDMFNQFPH